ncbi:Relaxin receptor 1 [Harpegnathos saltator]|uniref:Relaxin receptor 1 n=1 Tax=Harpegnathos saltator TaxID=610380 RepID=E2BT43_HARSA|nr:Relaxin receptor 1 [Harpegnathos saltator]
MRYRYVCIVDALLVVTLCLLYSGLMYYIGEGICNSDTEDATEPKPFVYVHRDLGKNKIREIQPGHLKGLTELQTLKLEQNKIAEADFSDLENSTDLSNIDLAHNEIVTLPPNVFRPVNNLTKLSVEDINMDNMNKRVFDKLPKLNFVRVIDVSFAGHTPLLRVIVWSISFVTCLGNGLVLWGRFTVRDENRVLSIVIGNLAVSDMLMGIYLFIIAVEDVRFRDNYKEEARVSVLILSFMSVERFVLITAPLRRHRAMTSQAAFLSMIVIWVAGLILAIMPAIHLRSSTKFYGVNGMCFPLHIDDPYLVGWEYSAFIFLGLNLVGRRTDFRNPFRNRAIQSLAFEFSNELKRAVGHYRLRLRQHVRQRLENATQRNATSLSNGDFELPLRFFLIVLTDAACWAPIIALKIVAIMKYPVPSRDQPAAVHLHYAEISRKDQRRLVRQDVQIRIDEILRARFTGTAYWCYQTKLNNIIAHPGYDDGGRKRTSPAFQLP